LHSYLTKDKGVIEMGDGSTIDSSSYGEFAYLINAFSSKAIFYIEPLSNQNDAILGKEWLYEQQPSIDWQQNIITLPDDEPNVRILQNLEFKANNEITFLCRKELNQLINHRQLEGYTIVLQHLDDYKTEASPIKSSILDSLIDSYNDCFPKDIPPGLLPKRHVDHAIPLMPMSEFPKQ
jgi:hypothetical protein